LDKANQYLSGFALLLRSSMLSTTKETIPLQTELKNLDNYIQLEILRFSFQYELYVDPALQTDIIEVPPLLAQPLIENAVKHGVSGKGTAGEIKFRIVKDKQDMLFSISDNGPGFDPSKAVDRHGIKLTRDRIELYSKHRRITLEIQSNTNGTTVLLRFKNWLEND
jgi:two-component system, LytTR family, sensor kinase